MLNFKESLVYRKVFSVLAPILIAGSNHKYDETRASIKTKFDELENDQKLTFPLIPRNTLGLYFAKSQIIFLNRMNLLNPGSYPVITLDKHLGNRVVLPNISLEGTTLGERVMNFAVFCWYANVVSVIKKEYSVIPIVTHGFRSDGYQLLLRAYMASRRNIFTQLFNSAPSGRSTHSTHHHAIDFTFEGFLNNPQGIRSLPSYQSMQTSPNIVFPYAHEPWHIEAPIEGLVGINPLAPKGSDIQTEVEYAAKIYKETIGETVRVIY